MSADVCEAWRGLLRAILADGRTVAPRGKLTRELPQRTIEVDMRRPVLTVPQRALGYRFMAAEAYWILTGDDRVATIAPYSKRIADFSDDGKTFFGAYGPKVLDQLPYVVKTLIEDRDTRQAGLTIWREKPPKTKDVPCTVAMFFGIRQGLLNCHVFMRSSDAWLGVPYDVFNFSMVAHAVCGHLERATDGEGDVRPGTLFLTAASSHLYESNWAEAQACIDAPSSEQRQTLPIHWLNHDVLTETLKALRETSPGDALRWWESKP